MIYCWHRTDLRVTDHLALHRAAALARATGTVVQPVFIFDPQFYGDRSLACDGRVEFCHERVASLREAYRERGSDLALLHGDPATRLATLANRTDSDGNSSGDGGVGGDDDDGDDAADDSDDNNSNSDNNNSDDDCETDVEELCYTRHPTARYGLRRDERVERALAASSVGVEALPEGAITVDACERGIDARTGWAERCEAYLTDDPLSDPDSGVLVPGSQALGSDVTIEGIEARYNVASAKGDVPRGGRRAARRRLDRFARTAVMEEYPSGISAPTEAERRTSRLSPYLRFGVLSVREAYRTAVDRVGAERAREFFKSRLFWNHHFRQKLADNPRLTVEAVNPVFRDLWADSTGDDGSEDGGKLSSSSEAGNDENASSEAGDGRAKGNENGSWSGDDRNWDRDRDRDRGRWERNRDYIEAWKRGETGFPMIDASMRALVESGVAQLPNPCNGRLLFRLRFETALNDRRGFHVLSLDRRRPGDQLRPVADATRTRRLSPESDLRSPQRRARTRF